MAEPSVSDAVKVQVQNLKAEGDGLFAQKKYKKAYVKYTQAIELDSSNAILYANRAASALSMKEYLDAASDAKEAVAIDPTYAKAWARLGKATHALGSYDRSASAFEKALSLLPAQLSAQEKTLKKQIEEGLESVREAIGRLRRQDDDSFARIPVGQINMEEMPWNRASTMMDELVSSQNPDSSAWIIRNAYREFTEGVEIMKLTKSRDQGDMIGYEGQPTALSTISNGILRDPRAFYMTDPKAWFEMYDRQVTFENSVRRGWLHGGARKVKKEAPERLNSSGWDDLRPALRMTISGWFMKAFMCASTHQHVTAVELYHRAVEILEWGRQMWSNVPQHTRGPIFDLTYIRAVKRFYMTSIMQAHATHGKSNSEFNLEEAVELAHAIIADVNANPPGPNPIPPLDPGTLLSFWTYPKAEALSVLGYYHMQAGLKSANNTAEARRHFTHAAEHYLESAETFPQDDEKHSYFLAIAVEAHWRRGTALRVTLPLCERIREGFEKSVYIWEAHYKNKGSAPVEQCLAFYEEWKKRVAEGEVTMDYEAKHEGIL